ncbi:MAG: transglutaminase domain-containing protein [Clostridiales bacterium]|nr:transglutaminase domain-containing protein [Clostridiales bacterium]
MGRDGAVIFYNDTAVYAKTTVLTVHVERENGTKAVNCRIQFELMNMAEFYPISTQYTDEEGRVSLELGEGTVQIFCSFHDEIGSVLVNTEDRKEVTIRLKNEKVFVEEEAEKEWQFFDLIAPLDYPMHPSQLTAEQKEQGRVKKQKADQIRDKKKENFYQKEKAKKYEGNETATTILKNAYGNFDEIYDFLEKDSNPYRLFLLQTLEVKDNRDGKSEVLEEHLQESLLVKETAFAYLEKMGEEQEQLFLQYVMNPRIRHEMIRPYRKEISKWFTKEEKQRFLKEPSEIWEYVSQHVVTTEERNYETVVTSPVGALMTGQGSELSKKTLFVAICRTLGIPARINPIHGNIEYWKDSGFIKANSDSKKKEEKLIDVIFNYEGETIPAYFVNWTIGKLEKKKEGSVFETLDYTKTSFETKKIKLQLPKGYYRLNTTMRIPNGNQMIAVKYFVITGEETKRVSSFLIRQPKTKDMLEDLKLESFSLKNGRNEDVLWEQIAKDKVALLAFLEVGMEPTEHVLNELKGKAEEIKEKDFTIVFVLKDKKDIENQTLKSLLKELPQIQIYYDDFKELPEMIARRMYTDPEKLPLLVVTTDGYHGRYACSGYNVGTVELLCNIRNIL